MRLDLTAEGGEPGLIQYINSDTKEIILERPTERIFEIIFDGDHEETMRIDKENEARRQKLAN